MNRFLASTLALALLGAGAAQAQTAQVRYADLNLSSAAGQAELDRRIEAAARRACAAELSTGSRIENRDDLSRCKALVRAQVAAALKA